MAAGVQQATFAAGCFWCLDAIFRKTIGVTNVQSGYSGGEHDSPTYDSIHTRNDGYAESVHIEFDPDQISYAVLLEIFWTSHNPTTPNQDGANIGQEYRSIIFYHDDEQKQQADISKHEVAPTLWDKPIVTEIVAFEKFYTAEDHHQNFFFEKPNNPYCMVVINPKLAKFKERFAEYVREEPLGT
ncbi:TPA: peptide-methionine (S)-S-oxide reductase MsrA [Candidatus Saccharibacteria bacterium]|nr:peptide-methionine (S)-S-oxide reductase MsrA [Candidatus Saccharibacteria bacterium]HIO87564.1 peptide-methionine (S)-S-oxide reductase [Candidatus Saccharibacteria bacterium]